MTAYDSITDTINDLKNAKKNYDRILNEYQGNPDLIEFYLPSAKFLIRELNEHLTHLIERETKVQINEEHDNVEPEIWVRLEGENFDGRGPIGVIGSYLQKLNTANKQAVNLLGNLQERFENAREIIDGISSLDLVSTAHGSFKLGLKRTDIKSRFEHEQLNLFYKDESEHKQIDDLKNMENLSIEGLKLIANTVKSSQDMTVFNELKDNFGDKNLKKLIHYTKDLVPSSRSTFDKVYFEGNNIHSFNNVEATKETRKHLIDIEKKLTKESTFVNGKGWIRAVDMDNFTGTIRPLHFKDTTLEEITCKFSTEKFSSNDVASFIDKFVQVDGFVVNNQHQVPIRIEVEEVALEDLTEIE